MATVTLQFRKTKLQPWAPAGGGGGQERALAPPPPGNSKIWAPPPKDNLTRKNFKKIYI